MTSKETTYNLIQDLSSLTTIPEETLKSVLVDKSSYCICNAVHETRLKKQSAITRIDIGIGSLLISRETTGILYKFIPAKELEDAVTAVITTNKNPLAERASKLLAKRFCDVYKEFF